MKAWCGFPGAFFQILLPDAPTPERCLEAYHLHRTRLELIAERKVRRRDDGNVEITGRDLRDREIQRDYFTPDRLSPGRSIKRGDRSPYSPHGNPPKIPRMGTLSRIRHLPLLARPSMMAKVADHPSRGFWDRRASFELGCYGSFHQTGVPLGRGLGLLLRGARSVSGMTRPTPWDGPTSEPRNGFVVLSPPLS